jgi:membrane protein
LLWRFGVRSLIRQIGKDQVTDVAASMTFYMVLSVFPLLAALVSMLSVFGTAERWVPVMTGMVEDLLGEGAADQFGDVLDRFMRSDAAGLVLIVGLVTAIWSASNYIGAFTRAMNRVFQVREGRFIVKLKLQQLGLTVGLIVSIMVILGTLVLSQPVVEWLARHLGLAGVAVQVWDWLRWPIIAVFVVLLLDLLYYATPNLRRRRWKLISVGSLVAIGLAVLIAVGFMGYLRLFNGTDNYTRTYGTLAGAIIALFMMWLINLSILIGAEVDAELERIRQLRSGVDAALRLQLEPRDSRQIKKTEQTDARLQTEGNTIRNGPWVTDPGGEAG